MSRPVVCSGSMPQLTVEGARALLAILTAAGLPIDVPDPVKAGGVDRSGNRRAGERHLRVVEEAA